MFGMARVHRDSCVDLATGPIVADFSHPSLGSHRCRARGLGAQGDTEPADQIAVEIDPSSSLSAEALTCGAKAKLSVVGTPLIASTPTPTINVVITRIDTDCLFVRLDGVIAKHLWADVATSHSSVPTTTDSFRVYRADVVTSADPAVLLFKENGRWLFPGEFVGNDVDHRHSKLVQSLLGATPQFQRILHIETDTTSTPGLLVLFNHFRVDEPTRIDPSAHPRFTESKWVALERHIRELSFSDPVHADIVTDALAATRRDPGDTITDPKPASRLLRASASVVTH